jgi:hypothetical protein
MIFPHLTGPHFTEPDKNSPPFFFVIFMMTHFWGLGVLGWMLIAGGKIFAPNIEMTIDMPGERGPAAFKMNGRTLKKYIQF